MKTEFSIKLGARIKHFRELNGLSQLELSSLVPCEPSTLAHYETGKNLVSMTRLQRIAEVLKVEPYLFFLWENPKNDAETVSIINSLISKADKVQISLIKKIIESVIELTPLK